MKRWSAYFLFCFLFNVCLQQGFSQSPYALKSSREIILSGAAIGISVPAYFLSENKHKLTVEEISNFKKEDVNSFDRAAINYYSAGAKNTSDVLLYSSLASPILLMLDKNIRENSWEASLLYLETIVVASVGINLSKGLVSRPRPYVYNPDVPGSVKQKTDATNSFFSGHTTMSAASAFFTAKIFCDYNPDSKLKPVAWICAATLPLATGYCRIRAGQHFPTDVIAGYCWGALSGILIPQLHKRKD